VLTTDIISTSDGRLEQHDQQFFYNRIRALEKCWTKAFHLQKTMLKS